MLPSADDTIKPRCQRTLKMFFSPQKKNHALLKLVPPSSPHLKNWPQGTANQQNIPMYMDECNKKYPVQNGSRSCFICYSPNRLTFRTKCVLRIRRIDASSCFPGRKVSRKISRSKRPPNTSRWTRAAKLSRRDLFEIMFENLSEIFVRNYFRNFFRYFCSNMYMLVENYVRKLVWKLC
jgi:hypothetical protein